MTTLTRSEQESADLAWLTGPEAASALAAALAPEGVMLAGPEVHEVHHRPGAGVTVGYDVRVRGHDGTESGVYLLMTTAPLPGGAGRDGVVALTRGDRTLHVWRHPSDPMLPGLTPACAVEEAARRVGFTPEEGPATLQLIGYRPLRRAVLCLSTPQRRVYLKVVRPDQLDALLIRNRCAAPAGAPAVLDVWPESVLVFPQAEGEPLPEVLARDGAAGVAPQVFLSCLDALDPAALALPRRPAWTDRTAHYAQAARNVLPDCVDRIAALADGIVAGLQRAPVGPTVVTHGDFHAANVLMTGTRISALLDVDTIGPGQRVDDLACLIGHMVVLPSLAPGVYPHVPQAVRRMLTAFDAVVHPGALRLRAAGVVLSLLASMPPQAEQDARLAAGSPGREAAQARADADAVRTDAVARLTAAELLVGEGLTLV
ncbi:MAG: phosphotransferase [Cellulomonadaceae bacterium]